MRSIRILVLYDGKAGHLSQSQGLAQLIANRVTVPCNIHIVSAKPFLKLLHRPIRFLAQALPRLLANAICSFYKMSTIKLRPDVIISFGGNVVALNIALHRFWQAPNLLIGGDGSGYRYNQQDWQTLGAALISLAQRYDIQWLITNSRRTDPTLLERLSEQINDKTTAQFCRYDLPNQPCIQSLLGASNRIFCTEDSLSMLSEAVAMNKPVVSLRPREFTEHETHAKILANMSSTGLIEQQTIECLQDYMPTEFTPIVSYEQQMTAVFNQINQSGFLDQFVNPSQPEFVLAGQQ